jgi:hypothetical protein
VRHWILRFEDGPLNDPRVITMEEAPPSVLMARYSFIQGWMLFDEDTEFPVNDDAPLYRYEEQSRSQLSDDAAAGSDKVIRGVVYRVARVIRDYETFVRVAAKRNGSTG